MSGLGIQRTMAERLRKGTIPATGLPEDLIFGILRHYIQATLLINGRKSINPTILSIQIRN